MQKSHTRSAAVTSAACRLGKAPERLWSATGPCRSDPPSLRTSSAARNLCPRFEQRVRIVLPLRGDPAGLKPGSSKCSTASTCLHCHKYDKQHGFPRVAQTSSFSFHRRLAGLSSRRRISGCADHDKAGNLGRPAHPIARSPGSGTCQNSGLRLAWAGSSARRIQ